MNCNIRVRKQRYVETVCEKSGGGKKMDKGQALKMIEDEYDKAVLENPKFNSAHEGKAVIEEELDELWDEIKKKPHMRNKDNMRKEAVQICAMSLRFMTDLT